MRESVVKKTVEVEEKTYVCDVPGCVFGTTDADTATRHQGKMHSFCGEIELDGTTYLRFESRSDLEAYVKSTHRSWPYSRHAWSGPGYYSQVQLRDPYDGEPYGCYEHCDESVRRRREDLEETYSTSASETREVDDVASTFCPYVPQSKTVQLLVDRADARPLAHTLEWLCRTAGSALSPHTIEVLRQMIVRLRPQPRPVEGGDDAHA